MENIYYIYLNKNKKSEENALLYLYESLIDLLDNIKSCEDFLDNIPLDFLSTDSIVHILNALSPIKKDLYNWEDFVITSYNKLVEFEGKKSANILLKVII